MPTLRFETFDLTADQSVRASKLRTVLSCHVPPRAVRTPRSFNAAAMARKVIRTRRLYLMHDGQHVGGEGVAASRFAQLLLALTLLVGVITLGPVEPQCCKAWYTWLSSQFFYSLL